MKKFKVFAIASALALTTAGVFAGSSKYFATPPNLYLEKTATDYVPLASGDVNSTNLQYGVSGTNVSITGANNYPVFTYISGTGYERVVTNTF